jgi:hypothetical protein
MAKHPLALQLPSHALPPHSNDNAASRRRTSTNVLEGERAYRLRGGTYEAFPAAEARRLLEPGPAHFRPRGSSFLTARSGPSSMVPEHKFQQCRKPKAGLAELRKRLLIGPGGIISAKGDRPGALWSAVLASHLLAFPDVDSA